MNEFQPVAAPGFGGGASQAAMGGQLRLGDPPSTPPPPPPLLLLLLLLDVDVDTVAVPPSPQPTAALSAQSVTVRKVYRWNMKKGCLVLA